MTDMKTIKANADDLSVAENSDKSVYVHKFVAPFEFEGKTYSQLTFNFGKLTGRDALAIESELQALGRPVVVPALSGEYLVRMAAKSCTEAIGTDIFDNMPIRDFQAIHSKARNFLLTSES